MGSLGLGHACRGDGSLANFVGFGKNLAVGAVLDGDVLVAVGDVGDLAEETTSNGCSNCRCSDVAMNCARVYERCEIVGDLYGEVDLSEWVSRVELRTEIEVVGNVNHQIRSAATPLQPAAWVAVCLAHLP